MWVMENLTDYDHEYDRGPRYQEMTFRKGGEYHDFKYFFAGDIREWLAGELHRTWIDFLPEKPDHSKLPTHLVIQCVCGEYKDVNPLTEDVNYLEVESAAKECAHKHVREEIEKIMERYQWDE